MRDAAPARSDRRPGRGEPADVSVVIVNWNAGDLLRQAVESLRDVPAACSVDVVVVDNASSDGSLAALEAPGAPVRSIANVENVGFARACNQGIEATRGRYVLLLNPDARVGPGAVETLVRFMDAHPDAAAAGPGLVNADESPQPSGWTFPSLRRLLAVHPLVARLLPAPEDPLGGRDFTRTAEVDEVSGACLIVRRAALDTVGPLDEGFFLYFEDVDWCLRAKRAGWRVYHVPAARVVHHWRSRTDPSPQAPIHHLRSQRRYVRKHFGRPACLLLAAVSTAVYLGLAARAAARALRDPLGPGRRELRRYRALLGVALGG